MSAIVSHGVVTSSERAMLPAIAGAAGYPNGPRAAVIGINRDSVRRECEFDPGPLCNCDIWVTAPASWADVTLRLRARTQDVWAEVDVATIPNAQHAQTTTTGTTGLLFEWRGDPADEFSVEAYNTAVDHAAMAQTASFCARAWGLDSGREVISPFAPLRREQHAVITTVTTAAAALAFAAPLSGRATYLSSLEISHDNAARQLVRIESVVGTLPPVVQGSWFVGPNGVFGQTFPKPKRFPPGALVQVVGTVAATFVFNLGGFQD